VTEPQAQQQVEQSQPDAEQADAGQSEAAQSHDQSQAESTGTGHPEVDAVVASLGELDGRPVSEHVQVFETAHERLRGALSDAADDPAHDPTGA
jgi:hypothetical protein